MDNYYEKHSSGLIWEQTKNNFLQCVPQKGFRGINKRTSIRFLFKSARFIYIVGIKTYFQCIIMKKGIFSEVHIQTVS